MAGNPLVGTKGEKSMVKNAAELSQNEYYKYRSFTQPERWQQMKAVNRTLFIPLYGKAQVSKQGIILRDRMAEKIWAKEAFPIKGKSKSKWLCYNMAMRARVFDDWTRRMLKEHPGTIVLHIGCGLDSRCCRVDAPGTDWFDCDFPDVISTRQKYFAPSAHYTMQCADATNQSDLQALPDADCATVVLEGLSMYLTNRQLRDMLRILHCKYREIHILMDVYTEFGAKASKYKNPVHDVGVTHLYGVGNMQELLTGTGLQPVCEHSFTPTALVNELQGFERWFFKLMFTGKLYGKIYKLYELAGE